MKAQKFFACVATVAMASSLVACSSSSSSSSSSDSKTLTVAVNQELTGQFLPMYASSSYDQYVVNLCFQPMLRYDGNSELQPELATDLPEVSEDGKTITFKLKEGVKFNDGTDFTSSDVKYTFTEMADPSYTGGNGDAVKNIEGYTDYYEGDAEEITGIETPDDYTVVFHLVDPQIDAISSLGTFNIASDEQFDYKKGETSEIEQGQEDVVGTGAYMLNTYEKATGASLVRNENFEAEDGEYNIDRIVIKKTDSSTELQELEKGDVDLMPEVIETTTVSEASQNEDIAFNTYTRSAVGFIAFNCNNGATSDKAVRQALAYATDRQGFVDSYFAWDDNASDEVSGTPAGYVPAAFWNPVSINSGSVVRGEEEVEGLNTYEYNIETAKQILDDAGWVVGDDGIREKDGQKLEVKFLLSEKNSVLDTLVPMIQKTWKEIGVDLKQTTLDFTSLLSTVQDESQDDSWNAMFMANSFSSAYDDGANSLYADVASQNYSRLHDENLQSLLAQGRAQSTAEESKKYYVEAMKVAADDCGYLPIYSGMMFNLYRSNVSLEGTGPICNWSNAMATIDKD